MNPTVYSLVTALAYYGAGAVYARRVVAEMARVTNRDKGYGNLFPYYTRLELVSIGAATLFFWPFVMVYRVFSAWLIAPLAKEAARKKDIADQINWWHNEIAGSTDPVYTQACHTIIEGLKEQL